MYRERLAEIGGKLEVARRMPECGSWFGVAKHQFRLQPAIEENELLAFELRHGISLPEDYREFLLFAGNGGAGPYYGIEPLSAWDTWFEEEAAEPGFLAAPCPLADGPALRQAWSAAQARDARRARGVVVAGAAPSQAWQAYLPAEWSAWGRGTIHLCDQGCTFSARLIVSGESRGRVVYLDAQMWQPPYFVRDGSFLDWYERWLDLAAAGAPPNHFGYDNPAFV